MSPKTDDVWFAAASSHFSSFPWMSLVERVQLYRTAFHTTQHTPTPTLISSCHHRGLSALLPREPLGIYASLTLTRVEAWNLHLASGKDPSRLQTDTKYSSEWPSRDLTLVLWTFFLSRRVHHHLHFFLWTFGMGREAYVQVELSSFVYLCLYTYIALQQSWHYFCLSLTATSLFFSRYLNFLFYFYFGVPSMKSPSFQFSHPLFLDSSESTPMDSFSQLRVTQVCLRCSQFCGAWPRFTVVDYGLPRFLCAAADALLSTVEGGSQHHHSHISCCLAYIFIVQAPYFW